MACVVGAVTVILSHTARFVSSFNTAWTELMSHAEGIPFPVLEVMVTQMLFLYAPEPSMVTCAFATHCTERAVCRYPSTVTFPVLLVRASLILILYSSSHSSSVPPFVSVISFIT